MVVLVCRHSVLQLMQAMDAGEAVRQTQALSNDAVVFMHMRYMSSLTPRCHNLVQQCLAMSPGVYQLRGFLPYSYCPVCDDGAGRLQDVRIQHKPSVNTIPTIPFDICSIAQTTLVTRHIYTQQVCMFQYAQHAGQGVWSSSLRTDYGWRVELGCKLRKWGWGGELVGGVRQSDWTRDPWRGGLVIGAGLGSGA